MYYAKINEPDWVIGCMLGVDFIGVVDCFTSIAVFNIIASTSNDNIARYFLRIDDPKAGGVAEQTSPAPSPIEFDSAWDFMIGRRLDLPLLQNFCTYEAS